MYFYFRKMQIQNQNLLSSDIWPSKHIFITSKVESARFQMFKTNNPILLNKTPMYKFLMQYILLKPEFCSCKAFFISGCVCFVVWISSVMFGSKVKYLNLNYLFVYNLNAKYTKYKLLWPCYSHILFNEISLAIKERHYRNFTLHSEVIIAWRGKNTSEWIQRQNSFLPLAT